MRRPLAAPRLVASSFKIMGSLGWAQCTWCWRWEYNMYIPDGIDGPLCGDCLDVRQAPAESRGASETDLDPPATQTLAALLVEQGFFADGRVPVEDMPGATGQRASRVARDATARGARAEISQHNDPSPLMPAADPRAHGADHTRGVISGPREYPSSKALCRICGNPDDHPHWRKHLDGLPDSPFYVHYTRGDQGTIWTTTCRGCSLQSHLFDHLTSWPLEVWQGLLVEMGRNGERWSRRAPPPPPESPPFPAPPPPPNSPPPPGPIRPQGVERPHPRPLRNQFPQPELILPPWASTVFDQTFHRHDTDRSGFIDAEEVEEVMRDLGMEPDPGEVLMSLMASNPTPGALFSYAEVKRMMMDNVHRWYTDDQFPQPELILPSWARVVFDQAFHRRDPDRSGVIDSEVVAEVMRDLGIKPEPGEVLGQPGAMLSYADVEKMMAGNAHRWYTDGTLPPLWGVVRELVRQESAGDRRGIS